MSTSERSALTRAERSPRAQLPCRAEAFRRSTRQAARRGRCAHAARRAAAPTDLRVSTARSRSRALSATASCEALQLRANLSLASSELGRERSLCEPQHSSPIRAQAEGRARIRGRRAAKPRGWGPIHDYEKHLHEIEEEHVLSE